MSNSKANECGGNAKRSLPSWMSGKDDGSTSQSKKPNSSDFGGSEPMVEAEVPRHGKRNGEGEGPGSSSLHRDFSTLLEGVVFALSGFVNPERSILRSQALEMGAQYKPDWNSDCTLLICAFPNTPKFRQVESDCGTIVSKEWISNCYAQKKLVDIESYLLFPGKPWRRSNLSHEASQAIPSPSKRPQKPVETTSHLKSNEREITQSREINSSRECFSPLKLKKWAIDDYHKTLSWLESQEEKPDPSEIKKIAAEGILTCLQDAIDSLHQNQDINQMTEEWKFVPEVVVELAKLSNTKKSISKDELRRYAADSKRIYEVELNSLLDNSPERKKKPNISKEPKNGHKAKKDMSFAHDYDSDDTIEMTEEEIDIAFEKVAGKKKA